MAQYEPYQQQYAQPHYPAETYQPPARSTDSLGSWMLTVFLTMIPLVGFIYTLVLAFGGTESIAKKNFARATLLWSIIVIVIGIVVAIILAVSGAAFFESIRQQTSGY